MKFLSRSVLKKLNYVKSIEKCSRLVGSNIYENNGGKNKNDFRINPKIVLGTALASIFIGYHFYDKRKHFVYAKEIKNETDGKKIAVGQFKKDLPCYSLDDVAKHTTKESKIWVTYKEGVYDITDFVEGHPGGEQILLAAGSSVEPFWLLYGIHENNHVYEILESLRIGNLNKDDVGKLSENMNDPYAKDPRRHPALKAASVKPFNAESPAFFLVETFITPNELFYVRNHLPVPEIDPETYELEIEIESRENTLTLTLDEIKSLPKHTITATIMCAGNRRSEMTKIKPVKGLSWGPAAIGNATWTGVRLCDVLKKAGIDENNENKYHHVQFEGFDFDVTGTTYGASIPIWRAVDKRCDVILAYEMNGVPIPPDHGFPIRVIVPGVVGARNVKWLGKITVSENESNSHWQQNDYKGFSPSTDWDTVDFTKSPAIQELPVISAICKPSEGEEVKVEDGHITVKGYAWSGGGQKIVRVDVTPDAGKTWLVANLDHQHPSKPPQHWSWTLWSVKIPVDKNLKTMELWAKAVDSSYNVQPESFENIWNLRGVLSNAYHRVKVTLIH